MDVPEIPRPLSAKYKGDFAYPTIKDRIPIILTKAVDTVYRLKPQIGEEYGEEGLEALKAIVGRMSKLKNEIQTNKPLPPLQDQRSDVTIWNEYLTEDSKVQQAAGGQSSWFCSAWLYTECYFYRRVQEAIELSMLNHIDPFGQQKQNALLSSMGPMNALATYLTATLDTLQGQTYVTALQEPFLQFLKISLWGNKCDLSISGGSENTQKVDPVTQLQHLEPNLLCSHADQLWHHLVNARQTKSSDVRLDVILDNAGFEVFSDLCLVDFVLSSKLVDVVHLHAKCFPWFVSDVTPSDFDFTLQQLVASGDHALANFGKKLQAHLKNASIVFKVHDFWTYPHEFSKMRQASPELYADLGRADLLIFKGDLNYRKLVRDRNWAPVTEFEQALCGFHPAPLCALRSLKCDMVVGLREGLAEQMEGKHPDWMLTGNFAVIQFCSKRVA